MKKHILSFALIATMIGSIAMSCNSQKKASGTDSTTTVTDTSKSTTDTAKRDTLKKDTTRKPPM